MGLIKEKPSCLVPIIFDLRQPGYPNKEVLSAACFKQHKVQNNCKFLGPVALRFPPFRRKLPFSLPPCVPYKYTINP